MFGKKKDKKKEKGKKETPGEEAFCNMDFNIVREPEISAPEHI